MLVSLPIAATVWPANAHDSQQFYVIPYVIDTFGIQEKAEFCADSAFDSADIRQIMRDWRNMKSMIAVNGRGNYKSETPKDNDYGKRWLLEQSNSVLEWVCKPTVNRMLGLKRAAVHAFSRLVANFMEHSWAGGKR